MGLLDRFAGSPRDRFAAAALKIARRTPGVLAAQYQPAKFAITVRRAGRSAPTWIFLDNVYTECQGLGRRARLDRLTRFIRIMGAPPVTDTWEEARPKLRPVLRPVTMGLAGVPGMQPPVSRPAWPYLKELVVIDQPESMAFVGPPSLEAWGVTAEDVFTAARANLAGIARRSLARDWPDQHALIRMVDTGDGYFTSLLLAPGWLDSVSDRIGAPVIAFVPDNNSMLLCARQSGGLAQLYDLVEKEFGEAARGLSPVGYTTDPSGAVIPYRPDADHPDRVPARRAEVILAATQYGAQSRWLTSQFAEAGIDVYVGGLVAASKPDEAPITVATWTDGITSLLPEAEYIAFVRDGRAGFRVPWRAVASLVDLDPEPILSPRRYRVTNWPAPEIMQALRAHAVE